MFSPRGVYLNNHLAGSILAIELMDHAIDRDRKLGLLSPYVNLLPEIQADQAVLRDLIERDDAGESKVKKAAAWLGEKFSRVHRDSSDDPARLGLIRLEEAEMLGLGILGKRALWLALRNLPRNVASLQEIQYDHLIARAEQQFDVVERYRQELAARFLTD